MWDNFKLNIVGTFLLRMKMSEELFLELHLTIFVFGVLLMNLFLIISHTLTNCCSPIVFNNIYMNSSNLINVFIIFLKLKYINHNINLPSSKKLFFQTM